MWFVPMVPVSLDNITEGGQDTYATASSHQPGERLREVK